MRAGITLAIFIAAIWSGSVSAGPGWDLNDVSILFPLPAQSADDVLLKTTSKGTLGALFARSHFDQLPDLIIKVTPDQVFGGLRVVGVRIDPCFIKSPLSACQPQIRLVWQLPTPLVPGQPPRVYDTALHTFYDLSTADFLTLRAEFAALKKNFGVSTQGLPLGPHPAILQQGLKGQFATELMRLILLHAGENNISRFTFMRVNWSLTQWDFAGFDVQAGATVPLNIPRVNVTMQSFINQALPPNQDYVYGGISPAAKGADTVDFLTANSKTVSESDSAAVLEAAMSAYRIENPQRFSAATVDCVSCHVAQHARIWAARAFPNLMIDAAGKQFAYASAFANLTNVSPHPEQTNSQRGFGYLDSDPAINQRVINESAVVADWLNNN